MVNADTAPALPWGASNERDNVQQVDARHSRSSHSLTTVEPEPDHTGTPQVEETWPSSGSTIEVSMCVTLSVACAIDVLWSVGVRSKEEPLSSEHR